MAYARSLSEMSQVNVIDERNNISHMRWAISTLQICTINFASCALEGLQTKYASYIRRLNFKKDE